MKIWNKVKLRANEPSTWAGLGLIVAGAGQALQINEAPAVADAIGQLGQNLTWQNALMVAFGLFATLKSEKGNK